MPSSVLPPAGHSGHSCLLRPNNCLCALMNNRTDRKFVFPKRNAFIKLGLIFAATGRIALPSPRRTAFAPNTKHRHTAPLLLSLVKVPCVCVRASYQTALVPSRRWVLVRVNVCQSFTANFLCSLPSSSSSEPSCLQCYPVVPRGTTATCGLP